MSYRIGDQPIPGYHLAGVLGEGGFGVVWKAFGPGRTPAALKIISLGRKQGLKEFKALALIKSINHPNLVPVQAFWLKDDNGNVLGDAALDVNASDLVRSHSGTLFVDEVSASRPTELIIAMGLGEKTLADRLQECQQLGLPGIPLDELLQYMESSGRAIDFLNSPRHDLGEGQIGALQHCDIKPQNIVIVGGDAQVCDFGLVRVLGDVRMTSVGVSLAYGAPELISKKPPSSSTDQYSLAISYVELRYGGLPFDEPDSPMSLIKSHLTGQLELSKLSPQERAVIRRATALEPANRYPNVAQMVRALRGATQSGVLPPEDSGSFPADDRGGVAVMPAVKTESGIDPKQTTRRGLDDTLPDIGPSRPRRLIGTRTVFAGAIVASLAVGFAAKGSRLMDLWHTDRVDDEDSDDSKIHKPDEADGHKVVGSTKSHSSLVTPPAPPPHDAVQQAKSEIAEAKQLLNRIEQSLLPAVLEHIDAAEGELNKADKQQMDPKNSQQVDDLGRQALLLKIRARHRQNEPNQEQIQRDLVELFTRVVKDGATPEGDWSPGRTALEPLLRLICSSIADQEDYQQSLPLLGSTVRALAAVGAMDDDWSPTQRELAELAEPKKLIIGQVFVALDGLTDRPAEALELCQRLSAALPSDPQVLYRKAVLEIRQSDIAAAADSLRRAVEQTAEPPPAEARELLAAVQAVLAIGARQSDSKQFDAQLVEADTHFPQMPTELRYEYADRLLKLAGSGRTEAPTALKHLALLLPKLAKSMRTETLNQGLKSLEIELAKRELQKWRKDIESPDFKQLAGRLKDFEPEGALRSLVHLARVECMLETESWPLAMQELTQAEAILADPDLDADPLDHSYMQYVKALFLHARPGRQHESEAANLVLKALSGASRPKYCGADRSARCSQMLCAAVAERAAEREADSTDDSVARWLGNPFGDAEAADTEFAWLQKARTLATALPPEMQLPAALAAVYKTEPDLDAARGALEGLNAAPADDSLSSVPGRLLQAQLQPDSREGRLAAIDAYRQIFDILRTAAKASHKELPPLQVYNKLVVPAIERASVFKTPKGLSDEQARAIADIFTAKGSLLRKHRFEAWPVPDVVAAAHEAYDAALAFDSHIAEAYAGRGWCYMNRTPKDLPSAQRDARQAITTDPRYAGGFSLSTNVLIEKSRGELEANRRLPHLEHAITAATTAIDLSAEDPTERAYALINRSLANVEFVNYSCEISRDQMRDHLQAAAEDARQATLTETLYLQYAFDSMGNALEDLAWLAGHEPTKNYEAAIEAFRSAVNEGTRDKSRSLMNLGRCRFKAVAYGGLPADLLNPAMEDLAQATELNPRLAEAFYWRGRVEQLRGQMAGGEESERHYNQAQSEYNKCLDIDKANHVALIYKANCYLAQKRWQQADGQFEAAFNAAHGVSSTFAMDYLAQWSQAIDPSAGAVSAPRLAALQAVEGRFADLHLPDVAEPLMFQGVVEEAHAHYDAAIAKYAAALKKDPAACQKDYSSWLHLRSSEAGCAKLLALSREGLPKAQAQAAQTGAAIIAHADEAETAARAHRSPAEEAVAAFQAGLSRSIVGQLTQNRPMQAVALAKYREALAIAPNHPRSAVWRFRLVDDWNKSFNITQPADVREALALLQDAMIRLPAGDPGRARIGTLQEELRRKLPPGTPGAGT